MRSARCSSASSWRCARAWTPATAPASEVGELAQPLLDVGRERPAGGGRCEHTPDPLVDGDGDAHARSHAVVVTGVGSSCAASVVVQARGPPGAQDLADQPLVLRGHLDVGTQGRRAAVDGDDGVGALPVQAHERGVLLDESGGLGRDRREELLLARAPGHELRHPAQCRLLAGEVLEPSPRLRRADRSGDDVGEPGEPMLGVGRQGDVRRRSPRATPTSGPPP